MSKSGFTTLNRWLGRKNKEKTSGSSASTMSNGKLSKSITNLSISSTNINETSQLEYNRITPLPVVTTNAAFEQTFRITVLLPKDQLYVARLGARVPLSKLLELVCENKQLDAEKYEFRNPVDPSQVYSCDLTIGAVGLSEVRLCHKSESYDSFNADEVIKLHRSTIIRESLSSSEFSSRNSKHTTKTTSPYSSSNSLNSMDSSGLNYSRTPITTQPPPATATAPMAQLQQQQKLQQIQNNSTATRVAAPPRKKRAAPRPPSQLVIPEKSALIIENIANGNSAHEPEEPQYAEPLKQQSALSAKDFSVSTPNLASSTMLHSDINGNNCMNGGSSSGEDENRSLNSNGYSDDTVLYAQVQKKNALNLGSVQNLSSNQPSSLPEPSPRKRLEQLKKKSAPAPPPRNSMYSDDTYSLNSMDSSSLPMTPTTMQSPALQLAADMPKPEERSQAVEVLEMPKPIPRITTSSTLLNATDLESELKNYESETSSTTTVQSAKSNVSKVMLNRTPTPEPRSLSCEPPELDYEVRMEHMKTSLEDDNISKQADSGIGEPIPSPIPDSLSSEVRTTLDVKGNFESSSDDDDMVKVYNFKLGKTMVKPLNETRTLEELTILNSAADSIDSHATLELTQQLSTPNTLSETSSWNFSIPISPPPNFADGKFAMENPEESSREDRAMELKQQQPQNDKPITPKIKERPKLYFETFKQEQVKTEQAAEAPRIMEAELQRAVTPAASNVAASPLDDILGELSGIMQTKGVDTLMRKHETNEPIESAKPNTLSNFCINPISKTAAGKPKEITLETVSKPEEATTAAALKTTSPTCFADEEKLYRKRSSITSLKQRKSITRSDSFHSTALATESKPLNSRSSSQLSLNRIESNLNRRRSSSELSIGESPGLQSLEIMKTILNSRKNSLNNSSSSGGEEERSGSSSLDKEINTRRPSGELKFASLDFKTKQIESKPLQQQQLELEVKVEKQQPSPAPQTKPTENEQPKEPTKIYKYSGPPSINLTTWNERPKSQLVAIKNEGDYIFGCKAQDNSSGSIPRNYRHSMYTPTSATAAQVTAAAPPPVAPKPAAVTTRMGIPEKEFKVPITVKPIKDVVIENRAAVTIEQKVVAQAELPKQQPQPTYQQEVKRVELAQSRSIIETQQPTYHQQELKRVDLTQSRPTIESVLRPQTQIIQNHGAYASTTLPRAVNKRFTMPAHSSSSNGSFTGQQALKSFNSIKTEETNTAQKQSALQTNTLPGPQLLRTVSKTQQQTQPEDKFKSEEDQKQPANSFAPFGQNTLKRTGLKEKMLLKEEQDKQKMEKSSVLITNGESKATFAIAPANNKSLTSAKLHLNLQKSNSVITSNTPSPTTASFALKPKSSTAPVQQIPPAPPLAPPMFNLKPVTVVKLAAPSTDPRDQLLDAIRSFSKDQLRQA